MIESLPSFFLNNSKYLSQKILKNLNHKNTFYDHFDHGIPPCESFLKFLDTINAKPFFEPIV